MPARFGQGLGEFFCGLIVIDIVLQDSHRDIHGFDKPLQMRFCVHERLLGIGFVWTRRRTPPPWLTAFRLGASEDVDLLGAGRVRRLLERQREVALGVREDHESVDMEVEVRFLAFRVDQGEPVLVHHDRVLDSLLRNATTGIRREGLAPVELDLPAAEHGLDGSRIHEPQTGGLQLLEGVLVELGLDLAVLASAATAGDGAGGRRALRLLGLGRSRCLGDLQLRRAA